MANFEKEYSLRKVKQPTDKYLDDVKEVLVNKGVVNDNTNYSDLDETISESLENLTPNNIRGNVKIGNVTGAIATTLKEVNIENYVKTTVFDNIFRASNGKDLYGGYSNVNKKGLYHVNLQTGICKKIYDTGYGWKYFFESSNGHIYISGTNTFLHLEGENATLLNNSSNWQYFFESSNGDVYVGNTSANGLCKLNGSNITNIYDAGICWYFFESSNGTIYVSGNTSGMGLLKIVDDTVTTVSPIAYRWRYFFESSNGTIYVNGNNETSDILCIEGDTVKTIAGLSNKEWMLFSEDDNGTIYISGNSGATGIYYISGTELVQIYNKGFFQTVFKNGSGEIFFTGTSGYGVIHVKDKAATQIYSSGYWKTYIKDKNGNVYVGSNTSGSDGGILYIEGTTVNKIVPSNIYGHFEATESGVLATESQNISGETIVLLIGNEAYLLV